MDKDLSAKDMLERFLFDARLQHTPISRLSGGERRRALFIACINDDAKCSWS